MARATKAPRKRRPKTEPATSPTTPGATLQEIVDTLGGIVEVVSAPTGMDVAVTEPTIFDPEVPQTSAGGRIVLAVGLRPDSREGRDAVTQSGAAGAAAVVFKDADADSPVARDSLDAGVAVLAIPADLPWERAFMLFNSVVATGSSSIGGDEEAGVPMGDLFALANAVAAAVGGATSVEDPRGKILAYSTLEGQAIDEVRRQGILGRQIPDAPAVRETYRVLWRSEKPVRFESIEGLDIFPRLAVPVRAGGEILGSLWIVEGDTLLGAEAERSLMEASRLAALHLLKARASEDLERRMRAELLRSVLEGTGSIPLAAARLGLPVDSDCAVMAFELPTVDPAERQLQHGRLVNLILFYCETFNRQAACAEMDNAAYALLPVTSPTQVERLAPLAKRIAETAESRLGLAASVGIGSVVSLRDAPASRREADRTLEVLASRPSLGPVASIDDVRAQAILLELKELAGPVLERGPLRTLLDQDTDRSRALIATLRAYLDAFGDVPTAAARLGVHHNTFRYRLRRALEMLELSDPEQRLVVELQLRLLDVKT